MSFDHFSGDRFRHGTTVLRWRPDKKPGQCRFDLLKQKVDRTGAIAQRVMRPCWFPRPLKKFCPMRREPKSVPLPQFRNEQAISIGKFEQKMISSSN